MPDTTTEKPLSELKGGDRLYCYNWEAKRVEAVTFVRHDVSEGELKAPVLITKGAGGAFSSSAVSDDFYQTSEAAAYAHALAEFKEGLPGVKAELEIAKRMLAEYQDEITKLEFIVGGF
jgi:hypothetical protein